MKKIVEIEFDSVETLDKFINSIKQNNGEIFKNIYVNRIYSSQRTMEDVLNRMITN